MIFGAVIICTSVQDSRAREEYRGCDFKRYYRSWRGSIPGAQRLREHPTSPSRNLKSPLSVVPVSQREQGEVDLGRSAQPDAIAFVAFNPSVCQKY